MSFNNSVDLTKAHVNKVNAKKTRDIQDFAQYKATLNEEAVDMKFHMKFDATLFWVSKGFNNYSNFKMWY